jgi:hypothetical protein
MEKVYINSETLASFAYDIEQNTLLVEFNNGSAYRYLDVPQRVYDGLIGTAFKEQAFNKSIKGNYAFQRLS